MSEHSYKHVNDAWPESVPSRHAKWWYKDNPTHELTPQEAISATKRLYRLAMGRAYKGKFEPTTGNRYTWPSSGVYRVNWTTGWRNLVHDISHYCARRKFPGKRPHDFRHALLEKELIEHVVKNRWHEGKLRREQKQEEPVDIKQVRYQRVLQRMENWEAKKLRAERALKKLKVQKAYYEKALGVNKPQPKKSGRPKDPPVLFSLEDPDPAMFN